MATRTFRVCAPITSGGRKPIVYRLRMSCAMPAAGRDKVGPPPFDHELAARNPSEPGQKAEVAIVLIVVIDSESMNRGDGGEQSFKPLPISALW